MKYMVTLTFLAVLISGACSNSLVGSSSGANGETGALQIAVAAARTQTLLPPIDMTVESYTFSGSGPNGATFTATAGENSVQIDDLVFGEWTITVDAANADGTVIARGQSIVTVSAGETQTISVVVTPLDGTGELAIDVTWPASDIQTPSIEAELTPATGSTQSLAFQIGSNGSASFQDSEIGTGYHTLAVRLYEEGDSGIHSLATGAVELVRIVKDQTTAGTFDFSYLNQTTGTIDVRITPELQEPLTVSIEGAPAEIVEGEGPTVSASVAESASVGNVVYVWYLNGQSRSTGASYTIPADLAAGSYRLDVTAISADGSRAGSATSSFDVSALSALELTPKDSTVSAAGGVLQYSATGTYADDGTTVDLTDRVAWNVDDTTIATIDSAGLLSALATGATVVRAAIGPRAANTAVSISQ